MSINVFFIRISRGRLGSQLGTQQILLLHTIGRKSGKEYVTPIAYFLTNGAYFLVGSNWGKPGNAAWYYNLEAHPETTIEVNGRMIPVRATEARGDEYERLWAYAIEHHPPYMRYRSMTSRHLPIMVLTPRT